MQHASVASRVSRPESDATRQKCEICDTHCDTHCELPTQDQRLFRETPIYRAAVHLPHAEFPEIRCATGSLDFHLSAAWAVFPNFARGHCGFPCISGTAAPKGPKVATEAFLKLIGCWWGHTGPLQCHSLPHAACTAKLKQALERKIVPFNGILQTSNKTGFCNLYKTRQHTYSCHTSAWLSDLF